MTFFEHPVADLRYGGAIPFLYGSFYERLHKKYISVYALKSHRLRSAMKKAVLRCKEAVHDIYLSSMKG